MRRALSIVVLALAGCGGLDNGPLTLGVVRGRLLETSERAVVAVLGSPEISTTPSATGEFELKAVPQGEVELIALATDRTAVRFFAQVHGGAVAQVGAVQPRPGGFIELQLRSPSFQRLGLSRVRVAGTPLSGVEVADSGDADVGPLPAGCYEVGVDSPGLGSLGRLVCVSEGRETHVELALPEPDGSRGREGCSVTGCEDGHACSASGSCSP